MSRATVAELGVHHLGRWVFNCWVVPDGGNGRPLVVDVGLPSTAANVDGLLGSGTLTNPPVVVATHLHSDHVAGIGPLRDRRHVDVCVPPKAADYRAGERPRTPGPREVAKIVPVLRSQPIDLGAYGELLRCRAGYGVGGFVDPAPGACLLRDGEHVPGADEWEVILAPGHTDDSVVLWNDSTRTLASGDAVLTVGGVAWFNPEVVDPVRQAETEERLRSLPVQVLLPGHGLPVVGHHVLADALSFHSRPRRQALRRG